MNVVKNGFYSIFLSQFSRVMTEQRWDISGAFPKIDFVCPKYLACPNPNVSQDVLLFALHPKGFFISDWFGHGIMSSQPWAHDARDDNLKSKHFLIMMIWIPTDFRTMYPFTYLVSMSLALKPQCFTVLPLDSCWEFGCWRPRPDP